MYLHRDYSKTPVPAKGLRYLQANSLFYQERTLETEGCEGYGKYIARNA